MTPIESHFDWVAAGVIIEGFGLLVTILTFWGKMSTAAFKVDVMWKTWMKHAENRAEDAGLVVKNSPIRLTEMGLAIFRGLQRDADFKEFWVSHSHDKSVVQVNLIEKILGDELLNRMRKENGVHEIEIIIAGIQYAREISEPLVTEADRKAGD